MKKCFYLAAVVCLACSCSKQAYQHYTARTAAIPTAVESLANVSDLEVTEHRVTGESTGKMLSKKQKELNAVADALRKAGGADVLLEPLYTYQYDKKNRLTSVTVTGYPARFRNFRTAVVEK